MRLKPLGANQTEVEESNGYVFYSYKTPVVVTLKSTGEVFVTKQKYSRTTDKHISNYLKLFNIDIKSDYQSYKLVSQETLEKLLTR